MRTAGLLKPVPRARSGIFFGESATSSALAFAQDVEHDVVLKIECKYHFCDEAAGSTCRDCGLRVHRGEPLGEHSLERVRWEEAERWEMEAATDAARLAREREREREEEHARIRALLAETSAEVLAEFAAMKEQMQTLQKNPPRQSGGCTVMYEEGGGR